MMKFSFVVFQLPVMVLAQGSFTSWSPPGPGDVRGPCPGLNSLANHGFIHHDGKGMTVDHLTSGISAGLNVGPDFSILVAGLGLVSSREPGTFSFNLDDIGAHNLVIEHDASLSRADAFFGDDESFNRTNWNMVLEAFGSSNKTSIATAAQARNIRLQDSFAHNPQTLFGPAQFLIAWIETSLYLQTMADPASGVADVEFVRYLFEKEKLPYEIGWRPSAAPINLGTLFAMSFELIAASGVPPPPGTDISPAGLLAAFGNLR